MKYDATSSNYTNYIKTFFQTLEEQFSQECLAELNKNDEVYDHISQVAKEFEDSELTEENAKTQASNFISLINL